MKGLFMRQSFALRLLSGAAATALLWFGATGAFAAGDGKEAPQEEVTVFDPSSVDTFAGAFLAGRTADVDRDYANAIAFYKKAITMEPGNAEIRQRLMVAYFMNGDFANGVKLAEAMKGDASVERITTVVRGLDAIQRKDYAAAENILKYEGPNDLERMMNSLLLAWAEMGDGKGEQALAMIATMKGPDWFSIFRNYHAGALAAAIGDTAKARKHLNDAVLDTTSGPTAPDTYLRAVMALARLEAAQGNRQKALDAISIGDRFIPNYTPLKALRDSISKGETPPQQITTATQGAAAVLFSIGSALNRQGADDAVALYLQASFALDPESADTLVLLGGLAENANQPQRAIDLYGRVPASSPMRRISELQLGLALAQTDRIDQARSHLKALIDSDPKDIRSYLAYGSVLSDAKDYAAMATNFDKAVEVIGPIPSKTDWSVFFQRGIAYERLKKWDQAEPNFRKALQLNPDQPQVLNYLGYSWVDMSRNLDEGLDMIKRAVELRPDDGYIVDSLGWAYFRMKQYDDAVTELERAAELKAGDPTVNDHLGDAYWMTGRKFEAVYQWKRALVMKPEEPEIPKIMAKIKDGLPDNPELVKEKKAEAAIPQAPVEVAAAAPMAVEPKPATPAAPAAATAAPAAPVAPAAAVTTEVPSEATVHTIAAGDSLWKIAEKALGDGQLFTDIINANPALKRHPDRIYPGQVIDLPPLQK